MVEQHPVKVHYLGSSPRGSARNLEVGFKSPGAPQVPVARLLRDFHIAG